jgi:putative SOS response-associated peptidase YedK
MPVILREESYDLWLNPQVDSGELKKLLEPYPSDEMKSYPVSSQVNKVEVDNEDLIKRVDVEVGATPSLF